MNDAEVAAMKTALAPQSAEKPLAARATRTHVTDLSAQGEPFLWGLGGALALGVVMIVGFLILVFWNGIVTFYPGRVAVATLNDGSRVAGEATRTEKFRPPLDVVNALPAPIRGKIAAEDGFTRRTLYRTGNYDIYNDDFKWVSEFQVRAVEYPTTMIFAERLEWGAFVGTIKSATANAPYEYGVAFHESTVERLIRESMRGG